MKMTNYISQLNGKEQNAIFCIKKLIATRIQPQIIYCYCCETIIHTKRSAFIGKQFQEERRFTCDLLIITIDEAAIDDTMKSEIQEIIVHFGKVNMIIHPLGFVLKQMNDRNLFFSWVCKNGILLYERNAATQLLPPAISNEYKQQADLFYVTDPQMANYLHEKLQLVTSTQSQKNIHSPIKPVEIRLTLDTANGWKPTATKM